MPALPAELVARYLARLRVPPAEPSAEALVALHRAHVERIPWETAWLHEGRAWGIAATSSAARIATTGRGGYCFHLNGGFAVLLESLGYQVSRRVGRVHGPDGLAADTPANHLALVVSDLPSDGCPDGRWYVDVGLGDGLHSPTPLVAGPIEQPPFTMALSALDAPPAGGAAGWHLAHDPIGSFAGMAFSATSTGLDAFAEEHVRLSTDPASNFVRFFVAKRRTADSVIVLRGLNHVVESPTGSTSTLVDDRAAWFELLTDDLGIVPGDPDRLWARVLRAHEVWTATIATSTTLPLVTGRSPWLVRPSRQRAVRSVRGSGPSSG